LSRAEQQSSGRDRVRREDPERTAPRRNAGGAFAQGAVDGGDIAGRTDAWRNVIERGVQLGYEVVQDQLDFGSRVASRLSGANHGAGGGRGQVGNLSDNILATLVEMSARYFDMMMGTSGRFGLTPTHSPPRVSVKIDAARAVDVLVDLVADQSGEGFLVRPLFSERDASPPLTGVELMAAQDGGLAIHVALPDRQPAGMYEGSVLDARTRRPLGRLVVTVGKLDRSGGARPKAAERSEAAQRKRAVKARRRRPARGGSSGAMR
jgi:hypothetical protein